MTKDLRLKYRKLASAYSVRYRKKISAGWLMERALTKYYHQSIDETAWKYWRNKHFNEIYWRDGGRCLWCHYLIPREECTLDHIMPTARGGKRMKMNNVTISCEECNNNKGQLTPEEYLIKLGFRP